MAIPVIIVDDNQIDRMMVRRRLSRAEGFEELREVPAGDTFLESYFDQPPPEDLAGRKVLILMDINMPRMDGFETIERMERFSADGVGLQSVVVLMLTSSDNPMDRARAEQLALVRGYVVKPLDQDGTEHLKEVYEAA